MKDVEKLISLVQERVDRNRDGLYALIKEMSYGTTRAKPEQITAMLGNLLKRYPPQLWRNDETGEVVLDSIAIMALREDPNVINGKEVWHEIERAVKGGGR